MANEEETTVSAVTLARAPGRALTFLLAVGRAPVIRGLLEVRGYTPAEHEAGWAKLRAVDPTAVTPAAPASSDPAMRAALALIAPWDNDNLPIADAALRKRVPAAHAYLFAGGLEASDGAESVTVVETFLTRVAGLEALAASKSKKGADGAEAPAVTPAQAKTALDLLDARGITPAVRASLKAALAVVRKGAGAERAVAVAPARAAAQQAALEALYEWISEWTLVARKAVPRRDHQIALGIAAKKAPKGTK